MKSYDTIVIGLGAMGSACVYQLSKIGNKVLGIDQFAPPHTFGSTHGDTRITRQAIGEGEEYVPLSLRSYEIWRELEVKSGKKLLTVTGGLIMGSDAGPALHGKKRFLQSTIDTARKFNIPHSVFSADELRNRFPQFRIEDDYTGYYEFNAGFLRPERCVETQIRLARQQGAEIVFDEHVRQVNPLADGSVEVRTNKGTYSASTAVISAGPWIAQLLPEFADLFKVYRQVLYWFDVAGEITPYLPENFPVFIIAGTGADVYGFPAIDGRQGGLKVAFEECFADTSPEHAGRDVPQLEIERAYEQYFSRHLPGLSSRCVRAATCLYTVTPDSGFVIDLHPEHRQIVIASPCSGHGFKHSAAIGEVLAELSINDETRADISAFRLGRFARSA